MQAQARAAQVARFQLALGQAETAAVAAAAAAAEAAAAEAAAAAASLVGWLPALITTFRGLKMQARADTVGTQCKLHTESACQ